MTPRMLRESPPVPVHHRNWQGNIAPMLPACSSMCDLLIILSAWSVRHSLALFLSFRMLWRRSPSGKGLSGGGREAGSWPSGRGGGTSLAEFGGTLRALSRSYSVSRRWMISAGMEWKWSQANFGFCAKRVSVCGALYPSMIRGILHLLNKLNPNNPILWAIVRHPRN